jgi:hypothetical protein
VEGIQRRFLCGGVGGLKKIAWVKWRKVCQPRSKGGLGVRDIKLVNVNLLAKWWWRIIEDDSALWKDVLEDLYGPSVGYRSRRDGEVWGSHSSRWWKDVMGLEGMGDVRWIYRELERKVGDGMNTFFWKDTWVTSVTLMEVFPCIFSLTLDQEELVGNLCSMVEGGGGSFGEGSCLSGRRSLLWTSWLGWRGRFWGIERTRGFGNRI